MDQDLEAYERRFRRAGLPNLIEGWSASEDVFTRAVPLLALVFVGELLGAIDRDWSLWANLAAGLGGLIFLVAELGVELGGARLEPLAALDHRALA